MVRLSPWDNHVLWYGLLILIAIFILYKLRTLNRRYREGVKRRERSKEILRKFNSLDERRIALDGQLDIWDSLSDGQKGILELSLQNWVEDYERISKESENYLKEAAGWSRKCHE